jgi:type III pantothenate kinase
MEERIRMLLAIDVGNTHTVIGLFESQELRFRWRLASDARRTADEFGILTRELCGQVGVNVDGIDGVIVCSVVPALTSAVVDMSKATLRTDPVVVGPTLKLGIKIDYFDPEEVGPDRLANAVAVHEMIKGPSIVVDFGTATTLDAVTADGHYLGGIIAPGVLTSAENLFSRGALLPRVAVDIPSRVMGRSTEEAMRSGIVYGAVGQVDGLLERMLDEWNVKSPTIIATGGLAELIAQLSEMIEKVDLNLTLKGLATIYRREVG